MIKSMVIIAATIPSVGTLFNIVRKEGNRSKSGTQLSALSYIPPFPFSLWSGGDIDFKDPWSWICESIHNLESKAPMDDLLLFLGNFKDNFVGLSLSLYANKQRPNHHIRAKNGQKIFVEKHLQRSR